MYPVSAAFQTAIKTTHTMSIKVEQLRASDLSTLAVLTPDDISGSVDVKSKEDTRRSFSLTVANRLVNGAGIYTPAQTSDALYMNSVLRLWRGIVFQNGTTEYAPLGTFRVNRSRTRSAGGLHVVEVDGVDFTKVLQYTALTGLVKYAGGSTIYSIFQDIATRAGVLSYNIDPYFQNVTLKPAPDGDLQFARGMTLVDTLAFMRENFGADSWFDPLGSLIVRRYLTVETQPAVWSFADTDPMTEEMALTWEDSVEVKNHIMVGGVSATIQPVFVEVKDNNQNSPTYVNGPLGDRAWEIDGDYITTSAIATDVGNAKLREKTYLTKQVEVTHGPYPMLDVYDVASVTSAELKLASANYYVSGMTIPLGLETQKTTLLAVRALP